MSKKLLPLLGLALLAACAEPPTGLSVNDPPSRVQPSPVETPVHKTCPAPQHADPLGGSQGALLKQCTPIQ